MKKKKNPELIRIKLTLLLRRTRIDSQFYGPHCATHPRESSNVLYQHHEWEVYIYSWNSRKLLSLLYLRFGETFENFTVT